MIDGNAISQIKSLSHVSIAVSDEDTHCIVVHLLFLGFHTSDEKTEPS